MITQNDVYFILSLICLGLGSFFLPLSLYILPSAWFGWVYSLPNFVYALHDWLQTFFNLNENVASWVVVDLFFILFLLFAWCTYYFSVKAKEGLRQASIQLTGDEEAMRPFREKQEQRENLLLVAKMVLIVILVFGISEFVHYLISTTQIK